MAKLVASNTAKDIRETTKSAFAIYEADNNDYSKAITALTKLKGIGPATASLLLSTYDPIQVPFFSDELYRYLHFEDTKSKGWDRKINYTMKEYKELFSKLQTLRSRLEKESKQQVSAIDIEKTAYVLGKEATSSTKSPPNKRDAEDQETLPPPPAKRRKSGNGVAPPSSKSASWIATDLRREEQVRRKGLNGSPTYDTLGYELDKEYIIKKTSNRMPSARSAWGKKAMDHFDKKRRETERKVKILGLAKSYNNISPFDEFAWDDKVARDLGIAYHLVGMEEYEEWKNKGFSVKEGELERENIPEEERERISRLASGSALRKGSKHR